MQICGLIYVILFSITKINSPNFNRGAQEKNMYNVTKNVRFVVKNSIGNLKTNHISDTNITYILSNINQIKALIPLSFYPKK